MSITTRARQLEFEAARRRVIETLDLPARTASTARRVSVLGAATVLFALAFASRLAINDPDALIANFYLVPVALLAVEFGPRAGALAAAVGLLLVFAWGALETVHVSALGYSSRGAAFLICGVLIGRFAERLREDIAGRERTQRALTLYAEQLQRANARLARSVERLEAFAEIARAVGGETDLRRILSLILAHARDIVPVQRLIIYLPAGEDRLSAAIEDAPDGAAVADVSIASSLAGRAFSSGHPLRVRAREQPEALAQLSPGAERAILVPLVFRGEVLGVLAGFDVESDSALDDEEEQLLRSVAASAATAVATARSVAATRLRLSLEAADQARARWARELHDETLQGLTGVRMVLSGGVARNDLTTLRRAVETADQHLGEETRKLRDLIAELRPATLDDLGLGPAIETLAARQSVRGGLEIDVSLELSPAVRLPRDAETAVYRIIQEALTNIAKHARAQHVQLHVAGRDSRLELSVTDDGCGFDPERTSEGFGLTGMRERALLLGGQLAVSSAPGGPTTVAAALPLDGAA